MAKPGKPTTCPQSIRSREKEKRAIELRLTGMYFKDIAKEMGCSIAGAQKLVKTGMHRISAPEAERLLSRDLALLDKMLADIMPDEFAVHEDYEVIETEKGKRYRRVTDNAEILEKVLKIVQTRHRILGTDKHVTAGRIETNGERSILEILSMPLVQAVAQKQRNGNGSHSPREP